MRPGGEGTPEIGEFAPAELGVVLGVSTVSARLLIGDALDLRHRLPRLWHRLQTGTIRVWVARRVAARTRDLSQRAAARVDDRMCQIAGRVSGGRLERILDDAIMAADPAKAKADAAAAAARQGVWLGRESEHGIATLFAKAPAPDLHRLSRSLDELARALTIIGDTDSHDVRRAKALALLADPEAALEVVRRANEVLDATTDEATVAGPHDGTAPRRPADLGTAVMYVHLSDTSLANPDQPGEVVRVEDLGPVLLDQVRDWLGHRNVIVKAVINIPDIRPVDCYEVPDRMSEAIRLRNPASPFPFSPNIGRTGDDDHTNAYQPMDEGGPPGQTTVSNLGRMPRFEHRVKTFAGWKVTQPRSGIWIWRSPHGHGYLVDHAGTTPLGKL